MEKYDCVIIGAGPSGLTAGIFSVRRAMKTLILGDPNSISSTEEASWIDNWPGIEEISGMELMKRFEDHARKLGVKIIKEKVVEIKRPKNGYFKVKTDKNVTYLGKTVIIATGTKHRKAMIKGEEKFSGKGVSYCPTCDSPLFRGKKVVVIGGGDSALTAALLLDKVGADVSIVHRRNQFRAVEYWRKLVKKRKIKVIWDSVALEIKGDKMVKSIILQNVKKKDKKEVPIDGVFISIGTVPTAELAKDIGIKLDKSGHIIVDRGMKTNVPGVYAAGDCTDTPLKQIVTACADGAVASTSAYNYVQGNGK